MTAPLSPIVVPAPVDIFAPFAKRINAAIGSTLCTCIGSGRTGYIVTATFVDGEDSEAVQIAEFKFAPMSGCHGLVIISGVRVSIPYRGKGLGLILEEYRIALARHEKVHGLMCTVNITNNRELKILHKTGWTPIYEFVNPKTTHTVAVFVKNVEA